MRKFSWLFLLLILVVFADGKEEVLEGKDFHVYYLGGQSNMDGYGHVKELPKELSGGVPQVWIFHGNTSADGTPADGNGKWSPLNVGHGVGFSSNGKTNKYSERFGAEITFSKRLSEVYPDRNIALIKYSRGGTSIDADTKNAKRFGCWAPNWEGGNGDGTNINQYDHFLATMANARRDADIDNDGKADRLIPAGIIWMQGESDASERKIAKRYKDNLTLLMYLIRKELGDMETKVVVGQIADWKVWPHRKIVRKAQVDFVNEDHNAVLVTSTDMYDNSDPWHYDSKGYLDLGVRFAEAVAGNKSDE